MEAFTAIFWTTFLTAFKTLQKSNNMILTILSLFRLEWAC